MNEYGTRPIKNKKGFIFYSSLNSWFIKIERKLLPILFSIQDNISQTTRFLSHNNTIESERVINQYFDSISPFRHLLRAQPHEMIDLYFVSFFNS